MTISDDNLNLFFKEPNTNSNNDEYISRQLLIEKYIDLNKENRYGETHADEVAYGLIGELFNTVSLKDRQA